MDDECCSSLKELLIDLAKVMKERINSRLSDKWIIPDAVEDKDKSDVKPVLKWFNDLLVKNKHCENFFGAMAKAIFVVWKNRNSGDQGETTQQSIVREVMKTRRNTSAYFQIMLCLQDLCSFRIHVKDHLGFKGIVAKALNAAEVVREGGLKNLCNTANYSYFALDLLKANNGNQENCAAFTKTSAVNVFAEGASELIKEINYSAKTPLHTQLSFVLSERANIFKSEFSEAIQKCNSTLISIQLEQIGPRF
jgi:hypothetical protein